MIIPLLCAALLGSPAAAAKPDAVARYFAERAKALEQSGETTDLFLGKATTTGLGVAARAKAKVPKEKEEGGYLRLVYDDGEDGKAAALLFTGFESKTRVREYLIGLDGTLLRAAEAGRPLDVKDAEVRRTLKKEVSNYRAKKPLPAGS